ncbi:MAG: DUF349 domain-containing protein, partial [Deltaproteobacteria bacterium]|nr:DUF349 domain-containing protein [Deltaproteobacteria bacterium]
MTRERAAAERAAAPLRPARPGPPPPRPRRPRERADEPDDYVRDLGPTDEKRAAREAEAKARREERDKLRAEDEARRKALAAEREARQKEDAERGAAIAASLRALCDDMDQLAASFDRPAEPRVDRGGAAAPEPAATEPAATEPAATEPAATAATETAAEPATTEGGGEAAGRGRRRRDERRGPDPQAKMREIDRLLGQAAKAFEQIGKVGAAERDAIADRYRAVRGKLVMKAGEMREAEDWQRWSNVPKAEALIATAKDMLAEPQATPDLANRLRQLQALWKEVGPMPQRRSKEAWEQFKGLCDQIYDKVKGVRAVENEKFAEVAKAKEALIAEAEVLADSTDWAATAEKLKGLQARWKESGHLPRKQGDELWKRFRGACDRFFERRKPVLEAQHGEEAENLRRKHALIARAQQVADKAPDDGGWGKAIGAIKDLQREWKEIGFVPRRDADAVYRAFRAACDALFAKRDAARDGEANAHRAELDAVRAEL